MDEIINKVDQSGIITLDLIKYKPRDDEFEVFDVVPFLLHGYLLQEKVFRAEMAQTNWSLYKDKDIIIYCSNDAIVPYWAYVFISSLLQPYARTIIYAADHQDHQHLLWMEKIRAIDYTIYKGKKVVLKASSEVAPEMFVIATKPLMTQVQTLMWGEAGSPLMIYKQKKTT